MNFQEWEDFQMLLDKFSINFNSFEIVPPALEYQLHRLSVISEVNLTKYRKETSGLVTSRDLHSFAEQLENVAKQLSVLQDVQRMENLAFRTREIISTDVKFLKDVRDRILYKMAAIEILVIPFKKKIDRTLLYMKTIKYAEQHRISLIGKDVSLIFLKRNKLLVYKHFSGNQTLFNGITKLSFTNVQTYITKSKTGYWQM